MSSGFKKRSKTFRFVLKGTHLGRERITVLRNETTKYKYKFVYLNLTRLRQTVLKVRIYQGGKLWIIY